MVLSTELLGLVSVCAIGVPEPLLEPVIPPAFVPIVHTKLLGVPDVNPILVAVPLHIVAVKVLVTKGVGFTVTVIVNAGPTHEANVDVGVTLYCTVPAVVLLELVNT